jgi:hypothetical protein
LELVYGLASKLPENSDIGPGSFQAASAYWFEITFGFVKIRPESF